jgi:tetratricopeptide (TPR) repeat protein
MLHNRTKRFALSLCVCVLMALSLTSEAWGQKRDPAARSSTSIAEAKANVDRGNLDAAEKTLWEILGTQPDNEEALTLLGVVRGRQQRYAEGESLFRRVLQLNPKSLPAARNLAGALVAQDKPDEAIRQYELAIQSHPENLEIKIEAAKLNLARGNFATALANLEAISGGLPPSAVPLKAASLLGLGKRTTAEELIARAKGSPAMALDLAHVFVEANDPDGALKALGLVNPVPKNLAGQVHYLQGRALRQKGNTTAAAASFRQALAIDPKSVDTMVAIAETLASENKHLDSMTMLEKARDLSPDSKDVLRHFIVEAMQAGQNNRAILAAQDLQGKSTLLEDRYLVASVMIQQKQYLSASHILEDYVGQRPQDAKAYLGLGMAYLNLLRYPDARQALERSLQIQPDLAESEFQLGTLSSQEGNRQDAVQRWKRVIELQPHHAQALFNLGGVYLESGDLADAESAFSRSLAADPNNMKAEYNLGLVQKKLGKSDEAKRHLDRYQKMQEEEHAANGNPSRATDHP